MGHGCYKETGSRALLGRIRERDHVELGFARPVFTPMYARDQEKTTHVDASVGRDSDAGSIPAASTISPSDIAEGVASQRSRPVRRKTTLAANRIASGPPVVGFTRLDIPDARV